MSWEIKLLYQWHSSHRNNTTDLLEELISLPDTLDILFLFGVEGLEVAQDLLLMLYSLNFDTSPVVNQLAGM